jgi:hypothetical protein
MLGIWRCFFELNEEKKLSFSISLFLLVQTWGVWANCDCLLFVCLSGEEMNDGGMWDHQLEGLAMMKWWMMIGKETKQSPQANQKN